MLPAKYENGNAVLAIPAYAVTQIKVEEETELEVRATRKAKQENKTTSKKEAKKSLELCGV